jgi:putative flippase GtrA
MISILKEQLRRPIIVHMIKFGVVGVVSTAIDFSGIYIFTHLKLTYLWAIFFAYLIASIVGYFLNNSWTYRHLGRRHNLLNLGQYTAISMVGLGITELVIYVLVGNFQANLFVGKLVAVVIVFFWNFFANRALTFRDPADTPVPPIL